MPPKTYDMRTIIREAAVRSQDPKKAGTVYEVTLPTCTCDDYLWRRTDPGTSPFCKHLLQALRDTGKDPADWAADFAKAATGDH